MKLYVLGLLLIANWCHAQEEFLEEPTKKTTPLSRARREAVDQLEKVAHALTQTIQAEVALLDDIMWTVRELSEGNKKNCLMKSLQADRAQTLAELVSAAETMQKQRQAVTSVETLITRGITEKKKK